MNNPKSSAAVDLAPGWVVALALREPISGLLCVVGEVQHVSPRGVRVTHIDYIVGKFVGWDMFVAWSNILGAQVGTADHEAALAHHGLDAFEEFQTEHQRHVKPTSAA